MTVALALEHETRSRAVIIICDVGESFVAPLRNLKECPHPKLQRTEDGTECGLWSTARRRPPFADHFPARLLQSQRNFRSDPLEEAALHDTAHTKLVSRLSQQRPLCHGVCQVHGPELLPEICPHLLHRIHGPSHTVAHFVGDVQRTHPSVSFWTHHRYNRFIQKLI